MGAALTVNVSATDPDGDGIAQWSVDLAALPAGNDAVFTPAPDLRSGTLRWTPAAADTGTYRVSFTASNALAGSATSQLLIRRANQPPVAALTT